MKHSVPGAWTAWTAITRSRYAIVALLLTFVGTSAYAASTQPNTEVTASGFMLKVNGKPFVIKGMNYSPVPIGTKPEFAPYGDYFIPRYANVWKPDIDNIRAAGVNVIRLYAGDPALNAGAPGTAGNWKDFLDYCWNGGNKPVYVIMTSFVVGTEIANGGDAFRRYISDYDKLVQSTVNHPAVFGYMVGNEIFDGVSGNPNFWTNFGKLVDTAKDAAGLLGKKPFLTTAVKDEPGWPPIKQGEKSGHLNNLDAWSVNIYRGPTIGVPGDSPFTQYAQLMTELGLKKPLIFGEWGTPHTTRTKADYGKNPAPLLPIINLDDVPAAEMGFGKDPSKPYFDARPVATFLNQEWDTIKANLAAKAEQVCVGGCIFDWSDEYWKANNLDVQVGGPDAAFQFTAFAGGYRDEAGFGVTNAVPQSTYGQGKPNISRTLFKGYEAVKTFYNASSHSGGELY
jgi:hypothetical protein